MCVVLQFSKTNIFVVSSKVNDHLHKSGTGTSLTNSMLEWNQENTKSGNKTWNDKSETIGFYVVPSNSYQPFPRMRLKP